MSDNSTLLWDEFSDLKFDEAGKIEKLRRLQKILKELASTDEREKIELIAKIASKYVSLGKKGKKTGAFLFHPLNKGPIYNALYIDSILEILYKADTELKNETLHQLGNGHIEFLDYKIKTAPRLYSSEDVFEKFSEDVINYSLSIELKKGYGIYGKKVENSSQRNWDKRWANFFLENSNQYYICFDFLYDDDIETWSDFLASCKIPKFEGSGRTVKQFRQDCGWFGEVIQVAYKNNHPEKEFYYNEFLRQGFPKDLIDKYTNKNSS